MTQLSITRIKVKSTKFMTSDLHLVVIVMFRNSKSRKLSLLEIMYFIAIIRIPPALKLLKDASIGEVL